jgi:hypothetical protein
VSVAVPATGTPPVLYYSAPMSIAGSATPLARATRRAWSVALPLVLALALAMSACGGGDESSDGGVSVVDKVDDKGSTGDPATTVEIVSPTEGATVGPTFTATVNVDGGLSRGSDVGNPTGLPHLHFRLDGGKFDPDSAEIGRAVAKLEYEDGYSASVKSELTYRDIPPGEHDLSVELVEGDHDPAHEIASAAVTFDVEK